MLDSIVAIDLRAETWCSVMVRMQFLKFDCSMLRSKVNSRSRNVGIAREKLSTSISWVEASAKISSRKTHPREYTSDVELRFSDAKTSGAIYFLVVRAGPSVVLLAVRLESREVPKSLSVDNNVSLLRSHCHEKVFVLT